jgi:hypothetical protein
MPASGLGDGINPADVGQDHRAGAAMPNNLSDLTIGEHLLGRLSGEQA